MKGTGRENWLFRRSYEQCRPLLWVSIDLSDEVAEAWNATNEHCLIPTKDIGEAHFCQMGPWWKHRTPSSNQPVNPGKKWGEQDMLWEEWRGNLFHFKKNLYTRRSRIHTGRWNCMKHIDELVRCEERPILNNEQDDAALVAGGRGRGRGRNRSRGRTRIEKEFGYEDQKNRGEGR